MKEKHKILIRVGLFALVAVLMFGFLNVFFQPAWMTWNNYDTTYGFYEEPDNTLEAVFVGSSVVATSIKPTQLYEEYGICAYNFGTGQQPMLASYYWLEEAYRLHSETLKIAVLDVSELREKSSESYYHKAIDAMELSDVKFRAMRDMADGDLSDTLNKLLPLYNYHDRWQSLEQTDFDKFTHDPNSGTRGYYCDKRYYWDIAANGGKTVPVKNPVLDKDAEPRELYEESVYYLDRMAAFCKEKGIKLVLIKTATDNWNSAAHNAVAQLAEQHGLEFMDFNYDPYYSAYGYVHAFDSLEGRHLNLYGATKFTSWMGRYLTEQCGATDVRGDARYAYMEDVVAEYDIRIDLSGALQTAESVEEYMKTALSANNTVFITAKTEAADAFTDELRQYFADIGMHKLSRLKHGDAFIGIVDNERVVYEMLKSDEDKEPLTYIGKLSDGTKFTLKSGGALQERIAYARIDGEQKAYNKRGLNIVVYNNDIGEVIHRMVFDTHATITRSCYSVELCEEVLAAGKDAKYEKDSIPARILAYQAGVEKKRNG